MHAASLRQRARRMEKTTERLLDNSDPKSPPPNFLAQAHRRTARVRLVLSSVAILAVFLVLARHKQASRTRVFETFDGVQWPVGQLKQSYALCSSSRGEHAVYTVSPEAGQEQAECLVVHGNEVVQVGSLSSASPSMACQLDEHEDVRRQFGDKDTVGPPAVRSDQTAFAPPKAGLKIHFLPAGATVTPGMVDSHGHLMMYGRWKSAVDLTGSRSMTEVNRRLAEFLKKNDDAREDKDRWIEGVGWDQNLFDPAVFPTAAELDEEPLLKDRKLILHRIDSHALLCSSAVLALLPSLPPFVPGGQILLSPMGDPTGVFLDNAMDLVESLRGEVTALERQRWLTVVGRDAVSKGLVGVHDAGTVFEEIDFYRQQAAKGSLPLRIYSMIMCPDQGVFCGDDVERVEWETYDGRFRVGGVKLISDGALGSWGAAMHEPYSDRADGWRGILLANEKSFEGLVDDWVRGGWQVNVHAIGDRANSLVLSAFAPHLPSSAPLNPLRLRIEHAQILTLPALAEVVAKGVIASYQPTHGTSDMGYAEDRMGSRIEGAYKWRSVVDGGGRITLGSDFPIESIDPLKGFYAAVTRLDEAGQSPHGPGGWYPEERLTRMQALKGLTLDTAYASFSENITGSLEPGKRADYVVWDRNLLTCPPQEILQAKAIMTVIDGQPVWGSL